jgi:hypothetical protein
MRSIALFAGCVVAVSSALVAVAACDGGSSELSRGGGPLDLPDRASPVGSPDGSSSGSDGGGSTEGGASEGGAIDGGRDLSSDRAAFFGASRCASAGLKFCEDFESGSLDTATWTKVGTAPVVDGLQHARGQKALHITVNGNGPSYIRETKSFPATNNSYWGRMFVWFESLPAAPLTYAHWTFAAATGTGVPGEIRLSGQLQNGKNLFGVGTDNQTPTGTGDWTNSDKDPANAPVAVPTKQWLCIEWLHQGSTNETRFFWDAVEHPSLYTSSSKHGGNANAYVLPQFAALWVGWNEYQTTTEKFEMWVDEIALDDQRIGCVL